jgi:serine/threonine protein kinase
MVNETCKEENGSRNEPKYVYGTKWSEKEYIIVLDAYYKYKGEPTHADSPFVQRLSKVMGRTVHSITYRLQNYASIDPEEQNPRRKGKEHITVFGRRMFIKWSENKDTLRATAEAFMRQEEEALTPNLFNPNPQRIPITFHNSYELLDQIGQGGFGIVLSCLNINDGFVYALKIIDTSRISNTDCLKRFSREIKALKAINHPNVIHIYEDNLEKESSFPGFVMDLAECDLTKYMAEKAKRNNNNNARPVLAKTEASTIFLSILDAIEAMHEAKIPVLHRDLNPNNILRMFDKTWTLADFSLAKFIPPEPVSVSYATRSNVSMGTPPYMAPEIYGSLKNASFQSDIWSLGWLMWELFSSEGPFPREKPSGLPENMESAFLKAVQHKPNDRFKSVREMRHAFVSCI